MKAIITCILTVISLNAMAQSASFDCQMDSDPAVEITGSLTVKEATILIKDENDTLGVRELTPERIVTLHRLERKKEDKYSFAKFYSDFNAWQDLEISVPKELQSAKFKAYLTVYMDNGDMMAPGEANTLSCKVK